MEIESCKFFPPHECT